MEVEIQGMPQSVKSQYQTRVKNCKTELLRYKKQAVRPLCPFNDHAYFIHICGEIIQKDLHLSTSRTELFSSSSDNPYASPDSAEHDQRTRLLAGTHVLTDGTRRLEDSHRIALETEDVGADILRTLRIQRGQIEHTRDMVGVYIICHFNKNHLTLASQLTETDANIGRASGTLKSMIRR